MRVGMTIPFRGVPLSGLPELVRRIDSAGYDDVWSEESVNLGGVTPLVIAAQHSERLRIATGIINVFTRGPALLAQTAAALAELSGNRFVLGLGTSSNVIVEQWNGIAFVRPLEKMRATVAYLRTVLAGERGAGGFKLAAVPEQPVPIILAALRPAMLRLASELADGAFTNLVPLESAGTVVKAFGSPGKELVCRFFSVPGPETEALAVARRFFVAYVTVPVYSEFFRWLGWSEAIEPVVEAWNGGDRTGAVELVPDELLRETFLLGPFEAQRERLVAFSEAGIDTAVIAVLAPPTALEPAIDAFAPG